MSEAPLIVDNFAGGGGASLGIEMALGRSPDIAINHDPEALAMHAANHPQTLHLSKNVWQVEPLEYVRRRRVALAWFSPDCKHFSKAKGGKPVKKNVRDLAWVVVRWAKEARPSLIILENVEEFQDWGPVSMDGVPCKDRKGRDFKRWKGELVRLGYKVEWKELRACDYGAPTIRKRLFLIARCDGKPIVWPEPTHGAPDSEAVKAGLRKPWRTAAEIIDWSLPCPSIFDTAAEIKEKWGVRAKRPLAEATKRRIAKGVVRYVVEDPDPFIVPLRYESEWPDGVSPVITGCGGRAAQSSPRRVDQPMPTMTAKPDHVVAAAHLAPFVSYGQHGGANRAVDEPHHTITASRKDQNAVVAPVLMRQFGKSHAADVNDPTPTVTAGGGGKTGVVAAFLAKHNTGATGSSLNDPAPTVTANSFIKRPGGASPLGVVAAHMMSLRGSDRRDAAVDAPLNTISAGGNHAALIASFLVKYYGTFQRGDLREPMSTDTTRDRCGLVTVEIDGATYAIVDIGMRMLTPRERFRAQGFPDDYIIDCEGPNGKPLTASAQGRMCGNSVSPVLARALVAANADESMGYGGSPRRQEAA